MAASAKLDKAGTAAVDSERAKKVFQNKSEKDEKGIISFEKQLKEARDKAEAADTSYNDVNKNLLFVNQNMKRPKKGLMLKKQKSQSWRKN